MKKIIATFLVALLPSIALSEHLQPSSVTIIPKLRYDKSRVVEIYGPIDDFLSHHAINRLKALDKKKGQITMLIDSPGGSIAAGAEIINAMESLENPLVCLIQKDAFSMAALISTACPKLYIHKFGLVMFHEASFTVGGTIDEIKHMLTVYKRFLHNFQAYIARKLGITVEELEEREKENWWMNAEDAVKCGFARAIVERVD